MLLHRDSVARIREYDRIVVDHWQRNVRVRRPTKLIIAHFVADAFERQQKQTIIMYQFIYQLFFWHIASASVLTFEIDHVCSLDVEQHADQEWTVLLGICHYSAVYVDFLVHYPCRIVVRLKRAVHCQTELNTNKFHCII